MTIKTICAKSRKKTIGPKSKISIKITKCAKGTISTISTISSQPLFSGGWAV